MYVRWLFLLELALYYLISHQCSCSVHPKRRLLYFFFGMQFILIFTCMYFCFMLLLLKFLIVYIHCQQLNAVYTTNLRIKWKENYYFNNFIIIFLCSNCFTKCKRILRLYNFHFNNLKIFTSHTSPRELYQLNFYKLTSR